MNLPATDQPLQCMEGLHQAIPALLATNDFLGNLASSLQVIGNTFELNALVFWVQDPSAAVSNSVVGLLAVEKSSGDWREWLERKADPGILVFKKAVIDRLCSGESLSGTYTQLFSKITLDWGISKTEHATLIPLLANGQLKGVLGLGRSGVGLNWSEPEQLSLDIYTQTLANWIERYEVFRSVRRERDQLRDVINLGEPLAVKEATLSRNWEHSITDAQLLNRKIATTIPDQIFIIDLHDYSNLYSNRPSFLGYALANIDNPFEFFQKLIHPDDLGPAFEHFFEKLMVANDDDIIESEYRMYTKSGELIWFNERVKVFKRDNEGQVWQYLNILQDITGRKLALQAEAESQQRYRNFITYSSDGIYYMNCGKPIDISLSPEQQVELYYEHAYIEEANPAIANMYGLENVEALINVTARELHEGEHFEVNKASFLELAYNDYRLVNTETIEKGLDGRVKYFLNHAVGSIINNQLVGIWGTQQDITAKKEAELAKKESDMLFRSLYEKNPLGVVIGDGKGNMLRCNDRFAQMLNYSEEELVGENFKMITHPDDFEEELDNIRATVRDKSPVIFLEKRYLGKNGRITWANLHMSLLYTEAGNLQLAIAMVEDVTEKRKIHLTLEKNEAFQKAILGTLPDLKFRISKEGYYIDYYPSPNDERDLVARPEDFLGKKVSDIIPEYIAAAVMKNIELALATGELREFEYVLPIEGKRNHYEMRISAINQDEVIAVIRNVSERNWAQIELNDKVRQLDEKNKQLKDYIDSNMQLENFAYIASHDLREPLRTMGTFAQLLKKRYGNQLDDAADTYIDFVVKSARDMNNLIEDLLTYSRVETQENPKEDIALPDLLREVIGSLKDTVEENGAKIKVSNIPARITANPNRLKQLFQNLIANAIKFRKPELEPVIQIDCSDLGQFWQFVVRDNGIGVDPEFHAKIFLLFKKLHSRQDFQGTGLGLAICKKVVEQLGGEIWIESEVGKGAALFFTIKKSVH